MSSKANDNRNKTFIPKDDPDNKKWWVIDLAGKTLGRTATHMATILRGKNKPTFTPHMDIGDHIVVINCEKVKVTGRKTEEIKYYRYSGYPGGLHVTDFDTMLERHPERIIEHAVKGMLPKTKLGRKMIKKLHIYAGPDHPHQAQNPEALEV
ncbi:50S ribosomal protein L13 [Gemmatimonas aurantiaca]|nr:50S ribosomal protein L13 [Gemmatimonas aurantiaca]